MHSVAHRSGTVNTSSTTYWECQECTGTHTTRLRGVWRHALNMGDLGGTCVVQCHASFQHRTNVVHDVLGVPGVHWNAHNTSPQSMDACTQHGCPGGHMGCTVLCGVLTPYTLRRGQMGSARSALERTQDVSEMCGHMYSTWGYIEYICCPALPTVLAPYTPRPGRVGSAKSALENAEHVPEVHVHMYSTWVKY